MTNSFEQARQAEMEYHQAFYEETALYQPGTWLARPVKVVMDLLDRLNLDRVRVLDLGCGVGRNSIPVASRIQACQGTIHCVDLLPVAIGKLSEYSREYNVQEVVTTEVSDAEYVQISPDAYDYIIACSCLEHVSGIEAFKSVLQRMIRGTKTDGIHCILMSTEVKEYDLQSGQEKDGLVELNLETELAIRLLREQYRGWDILIERYVPQSIKEHKRGRDIEFRSNWLTFAVQKRIDIS